MPTWKHTLDIADVWKDENLELPEQGAEIVKRIRASKFWPKDEDESQEFELLVDELEDVAKADDECWFNLVWNAFYDWADAARVWVKTF